MKSIKIVALAAALLMSLSGTAAAQTAAYPVEQPELIANPLYEAGPLPKTTCKEPRIRRGDRAQARAYIDAVIHCLERTWKKHLTDAGLPYEPVKVRHVSQIPKKYCDQDVTKDNSQAYYCDRTRTLILQTGKDWTSRPADLWLFYLASFMYGYHVQNLVGIADAFAALPYDSKSESYEQTRRNSLQVVCFATAFMKSVWPMKGRSMKDWNELMKLVSGDGSGDKSVWGRTVNVHFFAQRGFAHRDPGACNTWARDSSAVD